MSAKLPNKSKIHSRPPSGTAAANIYYDSTERDMGFFGFILDLTLKLDFVAFVGKRALDHQPWEDSDPVSLASSKPGKYTKYLRENSQLFLELFLVRMVGNFQKYLVDILREILRKEPAILKSKDSSLTLETILEFSSMDELTRHIIERKMSNLAYNGFSELRAWATERGIAIKSLDEQKIAEVVATRNLIVHNRSLVDEKYLKSVQESVLQLGQVRALDVDYFDESVDLLNDSVEQTDNTAIEKFGLDVVPMATPPDSAPSGDASENEGGQNS